MIQLSIIVLSYNTKDITLSCLQSLIKQYREELKSETVEIIVVDNASKDGSVEAIQNSKFKIQNYNSKLKIIQNKENFGFAKGCNIGGKESRGKYILFLNSDTQLLDKGFLKMVEFLDTHPRVGILGGRLLNKDGSSQPSCGKFYTLFNLFLMLMGLERLGILRTSPNRIQRVDWVSGGCMMIKKSFLEKLNGFDEKFFMYIEDMELCYRAKTIGILTYFYPNVSVLHKTLGSSNKAFAVINIYKGLLYFYRKHKNRLQYAIAKQMLKFKAGIGIFFGILTKNDYLITTYKKAIKF